MMKYLLRVLASLFVLTCIASQAKASGFRGHLDEFCRTAEYIVIAECIEQSYSKEGFEVTAKLEIEKIYKAPKTDPEPTILEVRGFTSTATRFHFRKGHRYVAFVFEGGRCDAQGSHFPLTRDGELPRAPFELICLEENTDTLDKLTRQIKRVLSGEYEKELIERINDKERSYCERCDDAMALIRTNPKTAVEVIATFLLETSRSDIWWKFIELDANRARDIAIQLISNADSIRRYDEAAYILSQPQCRIDDIENHYDMLVKAANKWEAGQANAGYRGMLPVFANSNCRSPEVKRMLLAVMSSPDATYSDAVTRSAIQLQFPESVPLFWNYIKKERLTSELVNLDGQIAAHVGAAKVYRYTNFELIQVSKAQRLIRDSYPEFIEYLPDAEVIRVDRALLFLIATDDGNKLTCLYAGYARDEKSRTHHKVFMLFDGR